MSFSQAITICFTKYANFSGRATRSEFWWFYLFALLLGWFASLVGATIDPVWGPNALNTVVNLALFLPIISAGTRRLHDIGKSGWWQLLMLTVIGIILLIIWWARIGIQEENEYGDFIKLADESLS